MGDRRDIATCRAPAAGCRGALLFAAGLAALAGLHLAAPKAKADRGPQLRGVMLTPNWEWPAPHGATDAQMLAEVNAACGLGATAVRFMVKWSHLEPARRTMDPGYAARVDRVLGAAQACGMKSIVTLLLTPCWAGSKHEPCTPRIEIEPPRKASLYAGATRRVLRRWGDRMVALEVWNEPNEELFWRGSARDYVRIVKAAGRAAARMNSGVKILAGAMAGPDRAFLKKMYKHDVRWHDGISIHPYNVKTAGASTGFSDPTLAGKAAASGSTAFRLGVPMIRRTMRRNKDGRKGIWLTEFGFAACPALGHCVSEATQAEWITKSFQIAAGWRYVRGLTLFSLRDQSNSADWHQRFGLLRHNFSARPSYPAVGSTLAALPP